MALQIGNIKTDSDGQNIIQFYSHVHFLALKIYFQVIQYKAIITRAIWELGPNNPNAGEQTIVNGNYDTFLDLKFVCLFNLHVLHKWKLW